MATAPHIAAALGRVEAEARAAVAAAKRFHALDGARRYAQDAGVRARTLARLGIAEGASASVIAAARRLLRSDARRRREEPLFAAPRLHRWALFAVVIGERRLAQMRREAPLTVPAPHPLALAAE